MITREEAEQELMNYANTENGFIHHKWSNKNFEYAYNTCAGSVSTCYIGDERWNELVDSFYNQYIIITSPLYQAMREEND